MTHMRHRESRDFQSREKVKASRRKRLVVIVVAVVAIAALWGQRDMWNRYGVFDWWSAKPRFIKANGRDYERGDDHEPGPHYCVIDTMFPFNYPIAADTEAGTAGRPCPPPHGASTFVYLHWKDNKWTVYVLQGAP